MIAANLDLTEDRVRAERVPGAVICLKKMISRAMVNRLHTTRMDRFVKLVMKGIEATNKKKLPGEEKLLQISIAEGRAIVGCVNNSEYYRKLESCSCIIIV